MSKTQRFEYGSRTDLSLTALPVAATGRAVKLKLAYRQKVQLGVRLDSSGLKRTERTGGRIGNR